MYNPVKLAT